MKTRFRGDKTRIREKTQKDIGVIQKIDDEHPEKAENKLMGIRDILENHINRAW